MIAGFWGEALSPTVAALIVDRQHLGHRLALAPRRVLHALSAFVAYALEEGVSTSDIAADVDTRDVRDLLACAIPTVHPRLYGVFDRLGERARPLTFHRRLNQTLQGPASGLLLDTDAIDEACLRVVEELVAEPVLLAGQKAIGRSESNLCVMRSALAFLRATGLSLDIEQLPCGSGWRSIKRRLTADLGRANAPPLPFRCPAGWTQVTRLSDLFQLGRTLENCVAAIGSGGEEHLMRFITGAEVFFTNDGERQTLASLHNVGPSLWVIGTVAVGRNRPRMPPLLDELRVVLREVLAEAGQVLLQTTPADALQAIGWRAERAVDLGEDNELDEAA